MKLKNVVEKYKNRYSISYLDLADAGESNRIIVQIASIILLIFSAFIFSLYSILYYSELAKHKTSLIYYAVYILLSIYGLIATRQIKEAERTKAYIKKTIPLYVMLFVVFGQAVKTFIGGLYFNGFITFCITAIIVLAVCSISPLIFLIGMTITIGFMSPGLLHNFGVTGLVNAVIMVVVMFCLSLYKRRIEKRHIQFLKKQKQSIEAKTFGNFTLMYENKVVKFSRTKSEELMGYLIYKKGSSVKTKELISVLWGERADSARYGSSFRNLIVDIKHTLNELEIQNFFIAEYNNFRINPEVIKCDYYDFLDGEPSAIKSFAGEFMSQFSWAEETVGFLEQKALKKN